MGCCVLEAVAGFHGVYFGVPVLELVDSGVHRDVVVLLVVGHLDVLGVMAGAQGELEAGLVLLTLGLHFLPRSQMEVAPFVFLSSPYAPQLAAAQFSVH